MIITPVRNSERQELLDLAVGTGLFSPSDAEGLLGRVLDSLSAHELPEGHAAVACRASEGEKILGWSYFAPDPYAESVFNVWWIGAAPLQHGRGVGSALLSHVEAEARSAGARVVVIETSDQPPMARARAFYVKRGYGERGRIPDFYAVSDTKVIFSRTLVGSA
jgi:ribosomal protein S18 acetylase RimI-like enzyme